jgi:hypothetical protein
VKTNSCTSLTHRSKILKEIENLKSHQHWSLLLSSCISLVFSECPSWCNSLIILTFIQTHGPTVCHGLYYCDPPCRCFDGRFYRPPFALYRLTFWVIPIGPIIYCSQRFSINFHYSRLHERSDCRRFVLDQSLWRLFSHGNSIVFRSFDTITYQCNIYQARLMAFCPGYQRASGDRVTMPQSCPQTFVKRSSQKVHKLSRWFWCHNKTPPGRIRKSFEAISKPIGFLPGNEITDHLSPASSSTALSGRF